jgi:hypothetical protein
MFTRSMTLRHCVYYRRKVHIAIYKIVSISNNNSTQLVITDIDIILLSTYLIW